MGVLEWNKLIADFMGKSFIEFHGMICECDHDGSPFDYDPIAWLNYHSDWQLLMPVVEKIEQGNYGFKMCRKVVEVYFDDTKEVILRRKEKSRIESLYGAVVDFLQSHNQPKA